MSKFLLILLILISWILFFGINGGAAYGGYLFYQSFGLLATIAAAIVPIVLLFFFNVFLLMSYAFIGGAIVNMERK